MVQITANIDVLLLTLLCVLALVKIVPGIYSFISFILKSLPYFSMFPKEDIDFMENISQQS